MTMKIGKTSNTLNDTQPQQIYGCIIATHHFGGKKAAQISNPAESPSFNATFGVLARSQTSRLGRRHCKNREGPVWSMMEAQRCRFCYILKLHSRRHVVLKCICLTTWFQPWGKVKRWFVSLIEFILVHFTCSVFNHNMCIYIIYV